MSHVSPKPRSNKARAQVNVSDMSSSADSIPSPVHADLERKTKECETARKLIEVMRQHRHDDLANIASLTTRVSELEGVVVGNREEVGGLRDQLLVKEMELKAQAGTLLVVSELSAQVTLLQAQLETKENELAQVAARVQAQFKAQTEELLVVPELRTQISQLTALLRLKEAELAVVPDLTEKLRLSQLELERAIPVLTANNAQLDTLLRVKEVELESAANALDQKTRDHDVLSARHTSTLQMKSDEIKALNSQVSSLIEQTRTSAVTSEKERTNEKAAVKKMELLVTELTTAKQSAERRARTAESKQQQLIDEIKALNAKLVKEDSVEKDLREEVDNLLLQQTQAIEKVSLANKQTTSTSRLLTDANNKLKATTHQLNTVEKLVSNKDTLITQLMRNDIQCKKTFDNRLANLNIQHHKNSKILALVTCIATLIISQVISLLISQK